MFTRIKPQVAKHSDGYFVQSNGRNSIKYIDGDLSAEVYVDPGPNMDNVYPETLKVKKNEKEVTVSLEEKRLILERIQKGLECLWA